MTSSPAMTRTCPLCPNRLQPYKQLCDPCRARRRRESNSITKLQYIAAGTCRDCGGELATVARCRPCQDKRNEWYRNLRKRKRAQAKLAQAKRAQVGSARTERNRRHTCPQ